MQSLYPRIRFIGSCNLCTLLFSFSWSRPAALCECPSICRLFRTWLGLAAPGWVCIFSPIFFYFFLPSFAFRSLPQPSFAFIGEARKREFGGVFERRRRVGGGILMGRNGPKRRSAARRNQFPLFPIFAQSRRERGERTLAKLRDADGVQGNGPTARGPGTAPRAERSRARAGRTSEAAQR